MTHWMEFNSVVESREDSTITLVWWLKFVLTWQSHSTQIEGSPTFPKFTLIPFHFCERPTFAPVLANGRKSEEDFCFYENRGKVRIQCLAGHFQGSAHPKWWGWPHPAPSPWATLSISATSHHGCEVYLWASVLNLDFFRAPISKICPMGLEKPKRGYSGDTWKFFHIS